MRRGKAGEAKSSDDGGTRDWRSSSKTLSFPVFLMILICSVHSSGPGGDGSHFRGPGCRRIVPLPPPGCGQLLRADGARRNGWFRLPTGRIIYVAGPLGRIVSTPAGSLNNRTGHELSFIELNFSQHRGTRNTRTPVYSSRAIHLQGIQDARDLNVHDGGITLEQESQIWRNQVASEPFRRTLPKGRRWPHD